MELMAGLKRAHALPRCLELMSRSGRRESGSILGFTNCRAIENARLVLQPRMSHSWRWQGRQPSNLRG